MCVVGEMWVGDVGGSVFVWCHLKPYWSGKDIVCADVSVVRYYAEL